MFDRLIQPGVQPPPTARGDPVNDPLRSFAFLGECGLGKPEFDETIERPVDQWSPHRHHTTNLGAWIELFGDGETMSWLLGKDPEDRKLSHGQSICGHLLHECRI